MFNCFRKSRPSVEMQNIEYTVTRGELTEDSKESYFGILYNNTFKVNKAIELTGVSFFGPKDDDKAVYLVYLEVRKLKSTTLTKFVVKDFWDTIATEKNNIFRVDFGTPIKIRAKKYYDIRFELKGPDTGICSDMVGSATVSTHKGKVHFDFPQGSKQIPEMHFKLG